MTGTQPGNPLVASPTSLPDSGALALVAPVDSMVTATTNLADGEFVEAGLAFAQGGLRTLGLTADPLAALYGWGVGWLIDHVQPFPRWLDELAGDPDEIHAFAATWGNVAGRVHDNADATRAAVSATTGDWRGLAAEAYERTADVVAGAVDGCGAMLAGVAGAVEVAGGLVGGVRATVEDTLEELVAAIGSALTKFLTVALAPEAVRSLSATVAGLAGRVGRLLDDLLASLGRFGRALDDLVPLLRAVGDEVERVTERWFDQPYSPGCLALNTGLQLSRADDYD